MTSAPYLLVGAALGLTALALTGLRWPTRVVFGSILFGATGFVIPQLARQARDRAEAPILQNILLIAIKEEQFRAATVNDRDNDGHGEYGTLFEMYRARPPLVDDALAGGEEHGYFFYVVFGPSVDDRERAFYAYAVPQRYGVTGRRAMYVDETGVVRMEDAGPVIFVTREAAQDWAPVPMDASF